MIIRLIEQNDKEFIMSTDKYVDATRFEYCVYTKSGYVICKDNKPIGKMF